MPLPMKQSARHTAILLAGSALFLCCNLFTLRGVPFLLDGDQVYFWTYGLRMLNGERMYRDFFSIRPPGAALVYGGLFGVFGQKIWVTNLAVLVLGVALCWLCFRIASRIMDTRLAFLATALFLTLVYNKMLNGTHHWFSVLAVMAAVATLAPGETLGRVAAAGCCLGIAAFFTQTRGPFAWLGIAAFLFWDWRRQKERWPQLLQRQGLLLACFAATLALLSSYFIAESGLRTLWYFQITYVRQHRVGAAFLGLPEAVKWSRLPSLAQYLWTYVLLPVAYALSLYRCCRGQFGRAMDNGRTLMLLTLVGAYLMVEVALNVNWLRVFVVTLPGIILAIWLVEETKALRRTVVPVLWILAACIAVAQVAYRQTRTGTVMELPGGRAAVRPKDFEKLDWLAQRTKPGDLFFQAGWTSFYLPLQLRNPLFVDVLESTAVTDPPDVDLSVQQMEVAKPRYVLWPPRLNALDSFYGPEQYHLGPFRNYLHANYKLAHSFSDGDELWEKK
jgi:Dolichyl-phosphate-mannose-protein mannosyltransferase